MFATGIIPSVLFFTGLFFIPESPRWLYKAGFRDKSMKVLTRIGGIALAEVEIKEIAASLEGNNLKVSFRELFSPSYRKVLLVGFLSGSAGSGQRNKHCHRLCPENTDGCRNTD